MCAYCGHESGFSKSSSPDSKFTGVNVIVFLCFCKALGKGATTQRRPRGAGTDDEKLCNGGFTHILECGSVTYFLHVGNVWFFCCCLVFVDWSILDEFVEFQKQNWIGWIKYPIPD